MASLVDNLNSKREDVLSHNYNLAVAQVHDEIENNPFKTEFIITSGCTDKNVLEEVCRRFNAGGVKATVYDNGSMLKSLWCLKVDLPLPESLIVKKVDVNVAKPDVAIEI